MKNKYFICYNIRLENYLTLNGILPVEYKDEYAVYAKTANLQQLLDAYWIKNKIFKEI